MTKLECSNADDSNTECCVFLQQETKECINIKAVHTDLRAMFCSLFSVGKKIQYIYGCGPELSEWKHY